MYTLLILTVWCSNWFIDRSDKFTMTKNNLTLTDPNPLWLKMVAQYRGLFEDRHYNTVRSRFSGLETNHSWVRPYILSSIPYDVKSWLRSDADSHTRMKRPLNAYRFPVVFQHWSIRYIHIYVHVFDTFKFDFGIDTSLLFVSFIEFYPIRWPMI